MKKNMYTALMVGLLAGVAQLGFADQVTIASSEGTWVNGGNKTVNYTANPTGRIRNGSFGADAGINNMLYKFDVAGALLPANITVNTVRIRFLTVMTGWTGSQDFGAVSLYNNVSDFSENTVNWNTAPGVGAAVDTLGHFGLAGAPTATFTDAIAQQNGWLEFQGAGAVALVQSWADGSDNFGVTLKSAALTDSSSRYFDLRLPDEGFAPTIIVDYTVIPEPATMGMVGLVGVAALFIRRTFMI